MPLPAELPAQNPYGPLVSFQTDKILPPSALYIGPNDSIVINVSNPSITVTLTVWYRILRPDGTLIATRQVFTSSNPPGVLNFSIPPAEGFLLSMVIQATGLSRGQCFVRAFLAPGGLAQTVSTLAHMFLQGYSSNIDLLCFPQSLAESSLGGRGWLRDIQVANVTGTSWSLTVPAGVHWLVRAITFNFIASSAVSTRTIRAQVLDPAGNNTFVVAAPATVVASSFTIYTFAPGLTSASLSGVQTAGFASELIVPVGWFLAASAVAGDAADQFSNIFVTVEEWVGQ